MNPEVLLIAEQDAMALLSEYDLVASEVPYAITLSGVGLEVTLRDVGGKEFVVWELADEALKRWANRITDDTWHPIRAKCFFHDGHVIVPCELTRQNRTGFSLMNAFYEMVLDRQSTAKI